MSVEDAFKVLISGGILNPTVSNLSPSSKVAIANPLENLQFEKEQLQTVSEEP